MSKEINLDDLVTDLEPAFDEWEVLGHLLELGTSKTTRIKEKFHTKYGDHGCMQQLLERWQTINPRKSHKAIILALERLDDKHRELATKLKFKYHLTANDDEMANDVDILNELYSLEDQYEEMVVRQEYEATAEMLQLEDEVPEMRGYLAKMFPSVVLSSCSTYEELFHDLHTKRLISMFNISALCNTEITNPKVKENLDNFTTNMSRFLRTTSVSAFLQAVCCRESDSSLDEMEQLEVKLSRSEGRQRTLEDMQKLVNKLVGEEKMHLQCYSFSLGYICWLYPKQLISNSQFKENVDNHVQVFKELGVQEIKVNGDCQWLFSKTEDCSATANHGQEKKESEDVDSPDLVNNPGTLRTRESNSPVSCSDERNRTFEQSDAATIVEEIHELDKEKVRHLGVQLGINISTLKQLDSTAAPSTFGLEVVSLWIDQVDNVQKTGLPSWATLSRALRRKSVSSVKLANGIDKKFPPCS